VSVRAFVFPEPGDRLSTVAARQFPGDDLAPKRLLSWNLHLVTRRSLSAEPVATNDPDLLPTDIVYVEPPLP
jgi:hypothetical protein